MTKYFLDEFNTAVAYIEYYFNIRKFSRNEEHELIDCGLNFDKSLVILHNAVTDFLYDDKELLLQRSVSKPQFMRFLVKHNFYVDEFYFNNVTVNYIMQNGTPYIIINEQDCKSVSFTALYIITLLYFITPVF
jgi:hypothetical protein